MISPSQRPLPDNIQHSQQTNMHVPGGIRTHNLSKRAAKDLSLRPRGHWDRRLKHVMERKKEELTGRRGRRRKRLLDGLKEKRGYWKLGNCTVWRTCFGRSCGPVLRQTTKWIKYPLYPPCLLFTWVRGTDQGIKRPGREADNTRRPV